MVGGRGNAMTRCGQKPAHPAAQQTLTHPLWISSKNICRGLTVPSGGIRSALSIGTVVCSGAVVVGQRSDRGVP